MATENYGISPAGIYLTDHGAEGPSANLGKFKIDDHAGPTFSLVRGDLDSFPVTPDEAGELAPLLAAFAREHGVAPAAEHETLTMPPGVDGPLVPGHVVTSTLLQRAMEENEKLREGLKEVLEQWRCSAATRERLSALLTEGS